MFPIKFCQLNIHPVPTTEAGGVEKAQAGRTKLGDKVIPHPAFTHALQGEAELPPEIASAAVERGQAQGLETTVAELLAEFEV